MERGGRGRGRMIRIGVFSWSGHFITILNSWFVACVSRTSNIMLQLEFLCRTITDEIVTTEHRKKMLLKKTDIRWLSSVEANTMSRFKRRLFYFFFFIHLGFLVQWEKLNTLTHPMVDSKAYANDLVDMIISIIEWDVMVQNSNKMWIQMHCSCLLLVLPFSMLLEIIGFYTVMVK